MTTLGPFQMSKAIFYENTESISPSLRSLFYHPKAHSIKNGFLIERGTNFYKNCHNKVLEKNMLYHLY